MNFIKNFCFGIAIGSGAILPGISSGVLCVRFGIYDKLVYSILHFFSDYKKNFSFLFPILLGTGLGAILFGRILKLLFYYFPSATCFCFIGLILGCTPILFKKANEEKGFRLHYLLYLIFTFLLTFFSLYVEQSFSNNIEANNPSFSYLVLCGFLMSIGVVIPGVSSTVILMLLGVYDLYLTSVSAITISILFPMGIGLLLGGFIFLKMISFLLKHYFSETYYAILGFTLSSTLVLYPGIEWNLLGLLHILLLLVCFKIGHLFEKE